MKSDTVKSYRINASVSLWDNLNSEESSIISGVQSEQLVLALIDRTEKLNEVFPSGYNEKMIEGLKMFLEACEDRINDRINRGVMGKLEK